jgi:hypothetical protein
MEKAPPKLLKVAGTSPKLGLRIFFADDRGHLAVSPGPGSGTAGRSASCWWKAATPCART